MKTSKKLICLLSLLIIAYFLVIGSVSAENQTGIVTHKTGEPFLEATVGNDTYNGVCLDYTKKYPSNTEYIISDGAGNTSDQVKNIIIKYYRENNTSRYNTLIQYTVWGATEGFNPFFTGMTEEERIITLGMLNDQTGVVGNTYIDENGLKYIFSFKYGTPSTDFTRQNALFFEYITEENVTNQTINQTTNQTNIANSTNTTETPELNKQNVTVNPANTVNSDEPKDPSNTVNSDEPKKTVNPVEPKNSLKPINSDESKIYTKAGMKTTGVPIIAFLLVLLGVLGVVISKSK